LLLSLRKRRPCGGSANQTDKFAPPHVWMAPAWQETF
jgi:hypothetical protein